VLQLASHLKYASTLHVQSWLGLERYCYWGIGYHPIFARIGYY